MGQSLIATYDDLRRAIATRRKACGYSQLAFDDRVGLTDGHTAKMEAGDRNYGPMTLPYILEALGCVLVLAPVRSVPHKRTDIPAQMPLPIDLPARAKLAKSQAPVRSDRRKRKANQ